MSADCRSSANRQAAPGSPSARVSFEEAQTAFSDEAAIHIEDPDHSASEERFILLGLSTIARLLVVVHVYRERDDTIRLISARKATRSERTQYGARWEP